MVARRHDIDTHVTNGLRHFSRDTHTARCVFHVGHHDVDGVLLDEERQRTLEALPPGLADDVTHKENLHVPMIAQAPLPSEPFARHGR